MGPLVSVLKLLGNRKEFTFSEYSSECKITITREWRKLHNEELSDLYSVPNIVRVVKSRRMR